MLIKLSTWSCLKIRMSMKIDNSSFERVEFKYFGTNKNSIQ